MRYFLIYTALMVLIATLFGCGTENPICTESFCIVDRDDVTGEVLTIDNAKALILLQTLAVDTTPEPEADTNTGTLAEIVDDVSTTGILSAYKEQTVNITAVAWINYSHVVSVNIQGIGLYTHNSKVSWIVIDNDGVNDLESVDTGATYTLSVNITEIRQNPTAPDKMTIYATLVRLPEKQIVAIQDVTIDEIVADVANGGTTYLKSTIRLSAVVLIDTVRLENTQGLVLQTDNDKVVFFLIDPDSTDDLTQYTANSTYEYVLYVSSITDAQGEFTISASVIDSQN